MKKLYIAPEVEITRFNTEDIMTTSAVVDVTVSEGAVTPDANGYTVNVNYGDLFKN